jgi:hypothetical protein
MKYSENFTVDITPNYMRDNNLFDSFFITLEIKNILHDRNVQFQICYNFDLKILEDYKIIYNNILEKLELKKENIVLNIWRAYHPGKYFIIKQSEFYKVNDTLEGKKEDIQISNYYIHK